MRWMFLNGEIVRGSAAQVSALDRGLLHGYGLFETMRSYGGRVFRLGEHYSRLCEGAARLAMDVPLSLSQLGEAVQALLRRNDLPDACLRLTVTAGPQPDAAGNAAEAAVFLSARPLTDYPQDLYRRGMAAVVSPVRRNETSPLSRIKSLNYLDNLLAREDAHRHGADEAILLNTRGFVAEGSASNVFLVHQGRLLTPGVEAGALPGITRQVVLELASALGFEPTESEVEPSALEDASEAFLTNSVMEVMPLTSLNGRPLGPGRPGPLTDRLRPLYRELAEAEPKT